MSRQSEESLGTFGNAPNQVYGGQKKNEVQNFRIDHNSFSNDRHGSEIDGLLDR